MYLLIKDFCDRYYPVVAYSNLNLDLCVYDEIHDEVVEGEKKWNDPVDLRGFVLPAEQVFPLTIFGIEELRDAVLQVSVPSLLEAGLAAQDAETKVVSFSIRTGDRFFYSGTEYDILVWKIGAVFGNSDIPTFYGANCVKVRRDAAAYEGL